MATILQAEEAARSSAKISNLEESFPRKMTYSPPWDRSGSCLCSAGHSGRRRVWRCKMSTRSALLVALALLFLAALPVAAAEPIQRGIDAWTTVPQGTYADLRDNPIPAGFFCREFAPFNGQI